jgi:hypothetical protein
MPAATRRILEGLFVQKKSVERELGGGVWECGGVWVGVGGGWGGFQSVVMAVMVEEDIDDIEAALVVPVRPHHTGRRHARNHAGRQAGRAGRT